ncbi:TPA: protein rep [Streptococcus suis]|nr:protein rep [Streptococcus suis]HEM6015642.1 protein rep [Streptococcus suis]HEM6379647.1 protein rep [Streptococcus suis]
MSDKTHLDELTAELFSDDLEAKKSNMDTVKNYEATTEELGTSEKKIKRVAECGSFKKYAVDATREHKALLYAQSCKDRFCPICNRAKALRDVREIMDVTKAMTSLNNYDTVFMTLTVVSDHDLKRALRQLHDGYHRLMRREMFTDVSKGVITKLEVTHNDKHGYHPHLHVLMFVGKLYYKKRKGFIEKADLLEAWREVTGDPRITQVDIRRPRANRRKGIADSNEAAALEVGKYVAKASDYNASPEVFAGFVSGLKGSKALRYTNQALEFRNAHKVDTYGIFKRLWKDRDEQELVEFVDKALLNWESNAYKVEYESLTDKEKDLLASRRELQDPSEIDSDLRKIAQEMKKLDNGPKLTKLRAKLRGLETLRWMRDCLDRLAS